MPAPLHRYFVTCAKGLEEVVAGELATEPIRASAIEPGSSGVWFQGETATGYRANLWLRAGIRVLQEHARAPVVGSEELYEWARGLDWTSLMRVDQTFSVEARVWDSALTHSKYAALTVKDALCDTFRAKGGERPNVDPNRADLPLFLYLHRDEAVLYRDLSGVTLHKRGYRDALHKSSLNEAVAAGILQLTAWDRGAPLLDPMCGSGTFVIEAALWAMNRAPGLLRQGFPFEAWPDFEKRAWNAALEEARDLARPKPAGELMANDVHAGSISLAKKDARAAGVERFIRFSSADVATYAPPVKPALAVCNPPWGERLDSPELEASWRELGRFLKRHCGGANAWILSGNAELTRFLSMKAARKFPLRLGKIDARALKYEILPPRI
ncbi:MAG: THUMP domain-containing protein [Planctomycetota bacterium]|nr:THUMP domain-containing protein [Planctomycetota bacterium]